MPHNSLELNGQRTNPELILDTHPWSDAVSRQAIFLAGEYLDTD
jgi:hypothetical protein